MVFRKLPRQYALPEHSCVEMRHLSCGTSKISGKATHSWKHSSMSCSYSDQFTTIPFFNGYVRSPSFLREARDEPGRFTAVGILTTGSRFPPKPAYIPQVFALAARCLSTPRLCTACRAEAHLPWCSWYPRLSRQGNTM
jgi:hypothetical protein